MNEGFSLSVTNLSQIYLMFENLSPWQSGRKPKKCVCEWVGGGASRYRTGINLKVSLISMYLLYLRIRFQTLHLDIAIVVSVSAESCVASKYVHELCSTYSYRIRGSSFFHEVATLSIKLSRK